MTGRVLEPNSKGLLVLILPLGVLMVLVYKAWRLILLVAFLAIAYISWDTYQWQKKCQQIDPVFGQLLKNNQGIITQADLLSSGIAKGPAARRYLEDKVQEYGAHQRTVQGIKAYYFITATTLGNILDDSEPETPQLLASSAPPVQMPEPAASVVPTAVEVAPATTSPFAQLAEIKEERNRQNVDLENPPKPAVLTVAQTLIQSELAKRLDTTSSTIARRKESPDFEDWTRTKDPEGWAWSYDPETKLFQTFSS